jgi:hypothetical protein
MTDYYNTNRLRGGELKNAIDAARSQQEKIKVYFQAHPERLYAPHQIRNLLFDDYNTPLTSIRRAMTNLETEGYLVKTSRMIKGDYGKPVHCWKCNNAHARQMKLELRG